MIRKYQTKQGLKWIATEAVWDNERNGSKEKTIDEIALMSLGFTSGMSVEQAREHAKKLNSKAAIDRKVQEQKIKAGERLTDLITIKNSIIPEEKSKAFVDHIEANWFGGDYNLRKRVQHWNYVQEILTDLKIEPREFYKKQKMFYKYFQSEGLSKSYVEKLISVINQWGDFYSEETMTYFKPLPNPKGIILQAIVDASDADGLGATPLDLDMLQKMKFKMETQEWKYIRATLWLGLRPSDLDELLENKDHFKIIEDGNETIAGIYQPKLMSVSKEKRWKYIPLFHSEMKASAYDILDNDMIKPTLNKIKRAADNVAGIGLYSGRKGFTDLMLGLGQKLEDVTMWIGHQSIERTWKSYKDKSRKAVSVTAAKLRLIK